MRHKLAIAGAVALVVVVSTASATGTGGKRLATSSSPGIRHQTPSTAPVSLPVATAPLSSRSRASRRAWTRLAARGNPFYLLNAERFAREVGPFEPPKRVASAWAFNSVAHQLVATAYAAADSSSPHRGRRDLVNNSIAAIDWLVSATDSEGAWWRPGLLGGDPNVNRFVLAPLLDSVRWLRTLPQGRAAWPRWKTKLATSVDLQRRAYRGQVSWDYGGLAGGEYANQDAYYALIMALSNGLFEQPADRALARTMVARIAGNLLPDGGIHYTGIENESPVYHALTLIILGRYATLTGDRVAISVLRRTANYWPLVLTAEGQPEYWSDVWWKQTWGFVWIEGLVVASGVTKDPRNQWLLWRVLERREPKDGGLYGIYAAPYWTGPAAGKPPARRFLTIDRNIRGIRGKVGQWYFGVARGRGLRNTFVGGLITSPTSRDPLRAAFRGAQILVMNDPERPHGSWLSQKADFGSLVLRPGVAGALGVRYTLQPSKINGAPTPETPASPWQVTQVWRAAGRGVLGLVALEATERAPASAVVGRLPLGPSPVEMVGPGLWKSGPLRVRLLQQFGDVVVSGQPDVSSERQWQGLELRQSSGGTVEQGQRFVYAAWVGPKESRPPKEFALLPDDAGWVAGWPDGHRVATVFNLTPEAREVRVPWSGSRPMGWFTGQRKARVLSLEGGSVSVSLESGQGALLERPARRPHTRATVRP